MALPILKGTFMVTISPAAWDNGCPWRELVQPAKHAKARSAERTLTLTLSHPMGEGTGFGRLFLAEE
jgi:hypothetical protein